MLRPILVVEDSAADLVLTRAALAGMNLQNPVDVARDGTEALDYLLRRGAFVTRADRTPVVVLLDLKMPRMDGLEVLQAIKSDGELRTIPVVMLTSSNAESDVVASYELGVNAYVVKPVAFQEFMRAVQATARFWGEVNEPAP